MPLRWPASCHRRVPGHRLPAARHRPPHHRPIPSTSSPPIPPARPPPSSRCCTSCASTPSRHMDIWCSTSSPPQEHPRPQFNDLTAPRAAGRGTGADSARRGDLALPAQSRARALGVASASGQGIKPLSTDFQTSSPGATSPTTQQRQNHPSLLGDGLPPGGRLWKVLKGRAALHSRGGRSSRARTACTLGVTCESEQGDHKAGCIHLGQGQHTNQGDQRAPTAGVKGLIS